MAGVTVLAAHHDPAVRRAVHAVVSASPGFEAVGEAASAEEALELAVALRPRLVLVAAKMPGIDGFETSRRLVSALPGTVVVLLRNADEPEGGEVGTPGAFASLDANVLTPASLRVLWERHRTR